MIVKIVEALTKEELAAAKQHFKKHSGSDFQEIVRNEIIRPNLARINVSLRSKNNEHYLSIALFQALTEMGEAEDRRPGRRRNDARRR